MSNINTTSSHQVWQAIMQLEEHVNELERELVLLRDRLDSLDAGE